jgi:hypothetical protein
MVAAYVTRYLRRLNRRFMKLHVQVLFLFYRYIYYNTVMSKYLTLLLSFRLHIYIFLFVVITIF